MSSHALTNFTPRQDFFSAGVSRINSIGRCDPLPFNLDDEEGLPVSDCWIRFPLSEDRSGIPAFFAVCVPTEGGTFSLSKTDTYRLLCHAMVHSLPETAFEEAVETLAGMYEYYRETPMIPAEPAPQSVKVKVTGSYATPIFPVLEE